MKHKIGIIGLGAIGSVIAKYLIPNHQLFFYTRTPKENINIEYQDQHFLFPIKCETTTISSIELDWLIICLKEHQFDFAHHLFEALISPNTKVAVIRNGLELTKDIEPYGNPNTIIPCLINCPVQPKRKGSYWQLHQPIITVPESNLANQFSDLFSLTELTVKQSDDFKTESWKKLIESASLGSIQCLTNQPCVIFKDSKIVTLYTNLITEGIAVALADGAGIQSNFKELLISRVKQYPADKGSSMLSDLKAGNPIELGAKNGAILKKAKFHQIEAPLNELFCTLIGQMNNN